MKKRIERLRGMHDLLPEAYQQQSRILDRLGTFLAQAGYDRVDSPVLEQGDLFLSSFGQELWQNLYTFRLHHRDLCLRPEYTASMCRLYLDHYQQHPLPLRFQYAGPVFRYETPGHGRYRQHTQLGVELFGGHIASADAEILQLACDALHELHIRQYRIELGHIGVASGFINRLHLDDQAARLLLSLMEQISRSEEGEQRVRARLEALYPGNDDIDDYLFPEQGPRSALHDIQPDQIDSGRPGRNELRPYESLLSGMSIPFGNDDARREVIERFLWKMGRSEQRRQILHGLEFLRALHAVAGSPPDVFEALRELSGRYKLSPEPLIELEQLVTIVEQTGVPSQNILLNLSLGRGVSYYTGLVFEIHAEDEDGFDAQLCGGGRYDRLMQVVGDSRSIKACGFAMGVERLLSLVPKNELPTSQITQALVIPVSVQDIPYALQIARSIRTGGLRTEVDVTGHGVGEGLKLATKKHIRQALIVGEDERQSHTVTLRNLMTAAEQALSVESAICRLRETRIEG